MKKFLCAAIFCLALSGCGLKSYSYKYDADTKTHTVGVPESIIKSTTGITPKATEINGRTYFSEDGKTYFIELQTKE